MRNITKTRYQKLEKLHHELDSKLDELSEMGEFLQEKFTTLLVTEENENGNTFMGLVEAIDELRDELYGELQGVADDAEMYYDSRSEKWMESEAGELYEQWKDEISDRCSDFEDTEALFTVEVDGDNILSGEINVSIEVEGLEELPRQSPND